MTPHQCSLTANLVDIVGRDIFHGTVTWAEGRITGIVRLGPEQAGQPYLLPGFVEAHVHIESSMLPPAEFARMAIPHGVLAAVCDPHEIANVLGREGIRFMVDNARQSPFVFAFGAPSCVPATPFETAGATLAADDIADLLAEGSCQFLAEMMNFPGVLNHDAGVMAKLAVARQAGVPVDGHAPGLQGEAAQRYAAAGITTDHECMTLAEAQDKINAGMHILIREGSAARNFDALHPLIARYPDQVMFCSDDKHPDDLLAGHINRHVQRARALGHDLFDVLRIASLNPVRHYRLPLGLLQPGDRFDAQLVDDLQTFTLQHAWLHGEPVYRDGGTLLPAVCTTTPNRFSPRTVTAAQFHLPACRQAHVICARDGRLLTDNQLTTPATAAGAIIADTDRDLLFLTVVNRYADAPPAVALVHGFGLQRGALASSVAHDSHNIVAVGCSPEELATVVNQVMETRGGLAVLDGDGLHSLPLPIAGLMSPDEGATVAARYQALDSRARALSGGQPPLRAPFMTLSFMALLVIPALKLSDRGLFDGQQFRFTALAV